MKVKCIANTGWDLSEKSIKAGEFKQSKFDLKIGAIYIVYSIVLFKGTLEYLISKEPGDPPFWYPVELFQVVDSLLPYEWYFSFRGYEKGPEEQDLSEAVWGYKEMAFDKNHLVDVIEREPEAMDIFFRNQREIDEYEELSKFRQKDS